MKNISNKKFAFYSSLIVITAAALFGCEQWAGQPSGSSDTSSVFVAKSLASLNTQTIQEVREALVDSNPIVRTNAIEVVSVSRRVDLMPNVVALLNDEFVPVKFALAIAVGEVRYYEGKKAVKKLLQDEDQNVRIAAAYALTRLRDGDYTRFIRDAILSENNTVRANAALLLGLLGNKNAIKDLYRALRAADSDDKVRFQAVEAIAMLGDEKIYPKIWAMLISAYADDRIMGIRAMGSLRTPQARNALISMLDDELIEIRLAAAEQLGTLRQITGESEVLEFLRNPPPREDAQANERRNVLAARAIARIGTPDLVKFLPNLLKNESIAVRLAAAQAVLMLQQ